MGFKPLKNHTPASERDQARSNMAAQWATLPEWIRGPFGATYSSAITLLDAGDDAAAIALIEYAAPPPGYDAEQVSVFEAARAEMLAGIQNLPSGN